MIAIGVDVSKGKSTVSACKPFGEIIFGPLDVAHTSNDLKELAESIKSLNEECRIVLEHTGKYYQPIARYLFDLGYFVSVVNPKLIHDFGNNSIRNVKTDKADSLKIANYTLANWDSLIPYDFEEDIRMQLKACCRQYYFYLNYRTSLKNNLISILDQTFPDCNYLFTSQKADGSTKWMDFALRFWHRDCVTKHSLADFTRIYNAWCKRHNYRPSDSKAASIYAFAAACVPSLPCNSSTKALIQTASEPLQATYNTMGNLLVEMNNLASQLPEYPVVMSMPGIGPAMCPQIIAEIGNIYRYHDKHALVAFAGVDAPPFQSGTFNSKRRKITKRGSANLRRVTFQIVCGILQRKAEEDPVYQFVRKKQSEGKPYYVYMIAGCNKFLRVYYGRVKEYLDKQA